jgi:hypothetical protein
MNVTEDNNMSFYWKTTLLLNLWSTHFIAYCVNTKDHDDDYVVKVSGIVASLTTIHSVFAFIEELGFSPMTSDLLDQKYLEFAEFSSKCSFEKPTISPSELEGVLTRIQGLKATFFELSN